MAATATFEQRRRAVGLLFVAPALVVLAVILGYPIIGSMMLALQKVQLSAGAIDRSFIGLGNFERLLADETFRRAAINTLYFSVMEVVLVVLLGLGIALLLNHPLGRSGFFRILLVVPWAIAPVANAVLWKWILNANYGVLNGILKSLGLIGSLPGVAGLADLGAELPAAGRCLEVGAVRGAAAARRPAARARHPLPRRLYGRRQPPGRASSTSPCPRSAARSPSPWCCRPSGRSGCSTSSSC